MAAGNNNKNESLFQLEQTVLQAARANLDDTRHAGNELMPQYASLSNEYAKLLKITKKIFRISDSQGKVLHQQQSAIQNLLDNVNQGFLTFGPDMKVNQEYSAECIRIFDRKIAGLSILELLGQDNHADGYHLGDLLAKVLSGGAEEAAILPLFPLTLKINGKDIRVEGKLLRQTSGEDNGRSFMMMLTDVTDQREAEEKIRFLSYHDKLTGLYNRSYVENLMRLETAHQWPLSLIMLDMNALKLVNDVFGHQQGDSLLVAMAAVLKRCCRPGDIICRWGGDEFLILLPNTGKEACQGIGECINRTCEEETERIIPLSVALGAATSCGELDFEALFVAAEVLMYNDKIKKSKDVRARIAGKFETMLEEQYFESSEHGRRIYRLLTGFIEYLGLGEEFGNHKMLQQLARFHDIGKVAISPDILAKPGPLTSSEWDIVKKHSEIGYRIALTSGEAAIAEIILAHHERWDGSGYPLGLRGTEVSLLARLLTIADVYDAITHERPYAKTMTPEEALEEMKKESGIVFEPELLEKFILYMSVDGNK